MRTTLTLDEDVAVIVERLRRSRRQTLKQVVNEALREGLKQLTLPPPARKPFRTTAVDLGECLLGNVDNVADVLAVAEGEAFK